MTKQIIKEMKKHYYPEWVEEFLSIKDIDIQE